MEPVTAQVAGAPRFPPGAATTSAAVAWGDACNFPIFPI
jgi:hypothetical protein